MRAKPANIGRAILSDLARRLARKGGNAASCARAARAFAHSEKGAISPILVLLLIPISGLLAVAGEFGYFSMAQRSQQHAADSAALAAAANDDSTLQGGVPRYKLEAQAVAAKYPVGSATVDVQLVACPDSAAGATDCYNAVITRPVQFQLARMVGIQSIVASANAMARRASVQDYCLVGMGGGGITLDGKSTGFDTCVVRSNAQVKCSSVKFQLIDSTANPQSCSGIPRLNSGSYTLPSSFNLSSQIPTTVSCSSDVNNLSWSSVAGDATTQYARLCSGSAIKQLSGDLSITISNQNKALILDGVSIDLNGHNFSATSTTANGNGTTVISTVTPTSGTLPTWFTNTSKNIDSLVSIAGPTTGTFANFAIMDNQSVTSATTYNPPNNPQININVLGLIYAPNRILTFNGPVNSSIGGYTCISIIGSSINSNGGKMQNNPTQDCSTLGYVTPHINVRQALIG